MLHSGHTLIVRNILFFVLFGPKFHTSNMPFHGAAWGVGGNFPTSLTTAPNRLLAHQHRPVNGDGWFGVTRNET